MAKIAVIFVLIALCSVAMGNRIPREEPANWDNLLASLKKLGDAASNFIQDPKTQNLIKDTQAEGETLLKAGNEQVTTILQSIKAKAEDLTKEGGDNFKKLAEEFNQSVQDVINKNKKN